MWSEVLEEAGNRLPTWAVLRTLQQINSATRIEEEAAMSAHPFFQSARRGDLLFWGGREGSTVVMRESLSEQERASWKHDARLDCVVQVKKWGGRNPLT